MMPGLEWVNAAYAGRPQITLLYGLDDTAELISTLTVLKLAGLRAVMESHYTMRIADGRRTHFPTLTQRPRDDDPDDAELLLLAPRTVTAGQSGITTETSCGPLRRDSRSVGQLSASSAREEEQVGRAGPAEGPATEAVQQRRSPRRGRSTHR